MILSPLELYH